VWIEFIVYVIIVFCTWKLVWSNWVIL